jgi:hypothetical protein
MHQMRIDFGILTETKIDNDMYMRDCCGYTVFVSHAKSKFMGGIALFYQMENAHWCIEGEIAHEPHIVSCILTSGECNWSIVGVYILPLEGDNDSVNYFIEAVRYCGTSDPYILMGHLNIDLNNLVDSHGDTIAAQLILHGLVLDDVGNHFMHPCG